MNIIVTRLVATVLLISAVAIPAAWGLDTATVAFAGVAVCSALLVISLGRFIPTTRRRLPRAHREP